MLGRLRQNASKPASGSLSTKTSDCDACQDARYVHPLLENGKPDYTRVVPCKCREEALAEHKRQHLLRLCQLPEGTENLTFETFDGYSESLGRAKDMAFKLARGRVKYIGWLTLVSGTDRGKTHLAIAICRKWLERGEPARYAYVPLLMDELRQGFSRAAPESYEEQFEFFCNVPLLVLDDLGVEKSSGWVQEKLDTIVHYRSIRGLPLVVTTNLPMDQLQVRIASRLQRYRPGMVIVIDAPEYRIKRKDKEE